MVIIQLLRVIMGLLAIGGLVATVVFWVMSIVQIFSRTDLKNNKWLWLALIIFVMPLGTIIFFFVENRKKLGIWTIVCFLAPLLVLPAYAIMQFVTMNLNSATY